MADSLEQRMYDVSLRTMVLRQLQPLAKGARDLTERDVLILELLGFQGRQCVSNIARLFPKASKATVSVNLTKLWRAGKIAKTIDPANQRMTWIKLTPGGRKALGEVQRQRKAHMATLAGMLRLSAAERATFEKIMGMLIAQADKTIHEFWAGHGKGNT